MKPGGRRAGEVARHNTGFTTPSNARGRRSLGRSRLRPVAGSIFLVRIRNSHNSHELIREVWVGSGADRQWNRGAASRIRDMSGQPHPPKPPVLGRIKFGRSSPRASCARFLSNRRGRVPVRKDQPLGLLEGCSPARSARLASSRHWRASSLKYLFSSVSGRASAFCSHCSAIRL
jgi:hypothetical protein